MVFQDDGLKTAEVNFWILERDSATHSGSLKASRVVCGQKRVKEEPPRFFLERCRF